MAKKQEPLDPQETALALIEAVLQFNRETPGIYKESYMLALRHQKRSLLRAQAAEEAED